MICHKHIHQIGRFWLKIVDLNTVDRIILIIDKRNGSVYTSDSFKKKGKWLYDVPRVNLLEGTPCRHLFEPNSCFFAFGLKINVVMEKNLRFLDYHSIVIRSMNIWLNVWQTILSDGIATIELSMFVYLPRSSLNFR